MRKVLRPGEDVRILWLFALAIAIAGYAWIDTRYEGAISRSVDRSARLYEATTRDDGIVAQSRRLARVQERTSTHLRRFARAAKDRGPAVALDALLASARRFGVALRSFAPGSDPARPPSARAATAGGLRAAPATIEARGRFRDLVGFVADLPRHAALLEVTSTQVERIGESADADDPPLSAIVRVRIYDAAALDAALGGADASPRR